MKISELITNIEKAAYLAEIAKDIPNFTKAHAIAALSFVNNHEASINIFLSVKGTKFTQEEKRILKEKVKEMSRHFNPNYDREQIEAIEDAYDMDYPKSTITCGQYYNGCKCQQCLNRKTLFR